MSDGKYWRVREEVEKILKEQSPIYYGKLVEQMSNDRDIFYAGIIIYEMTINGKVGWDSARNLRLLEERVNE